MTLQSDAHSMIAYGMLNYRKTLKRISTYTLSFQKSSLLYIFLYFYTRDVSKIVSFGRIVRFWPFSETSGGLKNVLSEYSEWLSEQFGEKRCGKTGKWFDWLKCSEVEGPRKYSQMSKKQSLLRLRHLYYYAKTCHYPFMSLYLWSAFESQERFSQTRPVRTRTVHVDTIRVDLIWPTASGRSNETVPVYLLVSGINWMKLYIYFN